MLQDAMRQASEKFIEGLIDEQELCVQLIIALGAYKVSDNSITDIAFALAEDRK
jgi:hypothetical protein